MTATQVYDLLRHLADSWGLMAMFVCFAVLAWWPFRPGARAVNDHVARMIFEDEDNDR
jgi:cytochrome c oxidase cbb3-type subunit 4